MQQQIAELQAAASENASLVKELAEQLQITVTALEQAAAVNQERVRRLYAISVTAMLVALVALFIAVFALLRASVLARSASTRSRRPDDSALARSTFDALFSASSSTQMIAPQRP